MTDRSGMPRVEFDRILVVQNDLLAYMNEREIGAAKAYLILEQCAESPGHYFADGPYLMRVAPKSNVLKRELGDDSLSIAAVGVDGSISNQQLKVGDIVQGPRDQRIGDNPNWIFTASPDQLQVIGRVTHITPYFA